MKYKFDIQKDGGVEPVNWDKINLPRSGPTRYPGEPQPDQEAKCLEAYKNGDSRPLKDYLDELKARVPTDPMHLGTPSKAFLEAAIAEGEGCTSVGGLAIELGLPVHPVLQEPVDPRPWEHQDRANYDLESMRAEFRARLDGPVGPTPKFNPTSKAWEMPDEPTGTSDAVE